MTDRLTSSNGQDRRAAWYVVGAALLFSAIPLAIDLSHTRTGPLTTGAGIALGFVGSTAVMHLHMYPPREFPQLSYRTVTARVVSSHVSIIQVLLTVVLMMLATLSYVAFAWSIDFVDTAVSSALYELWPMLWFVLLRRIDKIRHGPHRQSQISWTTYPLIGVGGAAILFVVYSAESVQTTGTPGGTPPVFGIILALLSPLLAALATSNFLFIDRILFGRSFYKRHNWPILTNPGLSVNEIEESLSFTGRVLAGILVSPLLVYLAIGEAGSLADVLQWSTLNGVVIGALLLAPAGLFMRRAHIISGKRELISIQYLSPALALAWLGIFTDVDISRLDFLVFGLLIIVSINLLLNLDPESTVADTAVATSGVAFSEDSQHMPSDARIQERYSLKALVLSLIAFGTGVYFRDEFLVDYHFGWLSGSYWAILALASTVFALLLAFRLTRVESLMISEDYRTLGIIRRIEMLPPRCFDQEPSDGSREYALTWVRRLNRSSSLNEYRHAYNRLHVLFSSLAARASSGALYLDAEERSEITMIRIELDALAHGRQQAREFAERVALWLIGGIILLLCLAVPSQQSSWPRLLTDVFAVLLASVVLFLLVHLADMRRARADELLRQKDPSWRFLPEGLYVRFRDERDTTTQRVFAGCLILVIVATVVGLLASRSF